MNNQLIHSGRDESNNGRGAAGLAAADREALEAFVRDADAGAYDDGDAENLAAAVETIRSLLEPTPTAGPTTESTTEPTPAATKWADAADYSGPTGESTSATGIDHPIDRIELPDAVDAAAARAAYDAVVEFLVATGPATASEIAGGVMPEHPLGYAPPSATDHEAATWWHEVIKPTLDADPTVSDDSPYGYELGGRGV
ncbi:hypothetical protein [Halonotius roseus]|uniref:Uncharacterized protein n=1 Tax=Halonotius roseus TaxID=2511997 RepID=A0A544QLK8_9EURY|nr:hypothetical protein [Halonotius roseus]TQQ79484.1 hypothetical protein EWF95_10720 [Halonotius roseus]